MGSAHSTTVWVQAKVTHGCCKDIISFASFLDNLWCTDNCFKTGVWLSAADYNTTSTPPAVRSWQHWYSWQHTLASCTSTIWCCTHTTFCPTWTQCTQIMIHKLPQAFLNIVPQKLRLSVPESDRFCLSHNWTVLHLADYVNACARFIFLCDIKQNISLVALFKLFCHIGIV